MQPMNKQTHTPGPWHVEHPFQEEGVYVSTKSTALVAKLYEPDKYAWHGDRVESIEANARLIASAPELLEALLALYHVSADLPDGKAYAEAAEQARAAIAKATGTEV